MKLGSPRRVPGSLLQIVDRRVPACRTSGMPPGDAPTPTVHTGPLDRGRSSSSVFPSQSSSRSLHEARRCRVGRRDRARRCRPGCSAVSHSLTPPAQVQAPTPQIVAGVEPSPRRPGRRSRRRGRCRRSVARRPALPAWQTVDPAALVVSTHPRARPGPRRHPRRTIVALVGEVRSSSVASVAVVVEVVAGLAPPIARGVSRAAGSSCEPVFSVSQHPQVPTGPRTHPTPSEQTVAQDCRGGILVAEPRRSRRRGRCMSSSVGAPGLSRPGSSSGRPGSSLHRPSPEASPANRDASHRCRRSPASR